MTDARTLVLVGDREHVEDLGGGYTLRGSVDAGAELYRGPFAGFGERTMIHTTAWILPKRYTVIDGQRVVADGYVDPVREVRGEETFAFVVAAPAAPGVGAPPPHGVILIPSEDLDVDVQEG